MGLVIFDLDGEADGKDGVWLVGLSICRRTGLPRSVGCCPRVRPRLPGSVSSWRTGAPPSRAELRWQTGVALNPDPVDFIEAPTSTSWAGVVLDSLGIVAVMRPLDDGKGLPWSNLRRVELPTRPVLSCSEVGGQGRGPVRVPTGPCLRNNCTFFAQICSASRDKLLEKPVLQDCWCP